MCVYAEPQSFVEKIDICVTEEDLRNICVRFVPDFSANAHYKIMGCAERNHKEGNGGYDRFKNTLLKDGVPVLVSIQRFGWSTSFDDSEDYTNESVQKTYLLQDDPIARKIFEAVKFQDVKMQCSKCGSSIFHRDCSYEYYTTGGDMEHVEWKHTCKNCGHIESAIQQSCYGYDNDYACPFPNCENKYRS